MNNLLYKELRLALHPTTIVFLLLGALILIPNYPYMVTFFYTCLSIFFMFQMSRENNDLFFTACLPVARRDVVKARCVAVMLMELAQIAVSALFLLLRQAVYPPDMANLAGLEPNAALFGFSFGLFALFNAIYLPWVYKTGDKVGVPFVVASIAVGVYIVGIEVVIQIVPQLKRALDTMNPGDLVYQLSILAIGIAVWAISMIGVCRCSQKRFERVNL